jgi:hydroxymethylpyrimidine/phosphomethylpyrimidine kinase
MTPGTAKSVPVALTIAGSDSGGGAGIQADLKTFRAFDVHGTSALTCVTAQNPDGVNAVEALPPSMVAEQVRTVCAGFPVAAAKTGMLYSREIISSVAAVVAECGIDVLVVDPVMVATSGARLLRGDAIEALCGELIPRATVVTPNAEEAAILCGHAVRSPDEVRDAAGEIASRFGVACVVKGGHVASETVLDVLFTGGHLHEFVGATVPARETHGTGCTFSAALCARLALGDTVPAAVPEAKAFVARALRDAAVAGKHRPLWT